MNLAQVARILAGFALFFSFAQCVPLALAWLAPDDATGCNARIGFLAGTLVGFAVAGLLWLGGRKGSRDFFRKEGLAAVGFAWLLAGGLGALPFLWSGALHNGIDAFFESVSGLTTTGASVFGAPSTRSIESLPRSLLLWRAQLHWMGGLGIIFVFVVLLPAMGVTGRNLLSSEQTGVSSSAVRPRLQQQGRLLLRIYVALTAANALLLWLAGQGVFDAVCHAFSTMASGGFSTRDVSVGAYRNLPVEIITTVFMFLAGCNFLLLVAAAWPLRDTPRTLWSSAEFRGYVKLTLGLIVVLTAILRGWGGTVTDRVLGVVHDYGDLGQCLRDASFQVVSLLTTTGFATVDYQNWPQPALLLLIGCVIVGGCTGSTAGGLKVLRVLVALQLVAYTLRHFLRPKSVEKLRVGDDVIPNSIVSAVLALIVLWLLGIALGAFALLFDPRFDLLSAVSTSASMMGCAGPALTSAVAASADASAAIDVGPYGSYGALHLPAKLLLAFQMILGRLEILTPLVLLYPTFWRR